ncbi:MAG: addiction module protein [Acidobacteria bacterium]|nr:addiction module protein [Acidobacteriota bacterium]
MSITTANIEEVALSLPADSRARLATKLVDSLDSVDESAALRDARVLELRRRMSKIASGEAEFVNEAAAFERVDTILAR